MKILLIRLSSIGDCVMASPLVSALRERYPQAHIAWAVQNKSVGVVRGLPGLSEVLEWNKGEKNALLQVLGQAWRGRYDVALDLHGLDKAALFLLGSRAKRRITGSGARTLPRLVSNVIVPEEARIHVREFYFNRAASLDLAPDAAQRFFPVLPLTPAHEAKASRILLENDCGEPHCLIGLNLGASDEEKRWPAPRFARLAHQLLSENPATRVLLFGPRSDEPLLAEFRAEFEALPSLSSQQDGAQDARVVSLVGKTELLELAVLARCCHAFVTADTGPMHLAAAVGAPVVALFGPTRLWRTAPIQNPQGAPMLILDAAHITGAWPAPMITHTVASVAQAVTEVAARQMVVGEAGHSKTRSATLKNQLVKDERENC